VPPPPEGACTRNGAAWVCPHPQPSPQQPLTPPAPLQDTAADQVIPKVPTLPLVPPAAVLIDVQERTASRNRFQESARSTSTSEEMLATPPWVPSLLPNEPVQSENLAAPQPPTSPSCSLNLLSPTDLVEIVEDLERHFAYEADPEELGPKVAPASAPCSPEKQWRSLPPKARRRSEGSGYAAPMMQTEWSV
jgi:hypothetical protein